MLASSLSDTMSCRRGVLLLATLLVNYCQRRKLTANLVVTHTVARVCVNGRGAIVRSKPLPKKTYSCSHHLKKGKAGDINKGRARPRKSERARSRERRERNQEKVGESEIERNFIL